MSQRCSGCRHSPIASPRWTTQAREGVVPGREVGLVPEAGEEGAGWGDVKFHRVDLHGRFRLHTFSHSHGDQHVVRSLAVARGGLWCVVVVIVVNVVEGMVKGVSAA